MGGDAGLHSPYKYPCGGNETAIADVGTGTGLVIILWGVNYDYLQLQNLAFGLG